MLRMICCLVVMLALFLSPGCGKGDSVPSAVRRAESAPGAPGVPPSSKEDTKEFNVGDAESNIEIKLEVDPQSKPETVVEDQVLTAKKTLSQANVSVKDPALSSLWVRIHVQPRAAFAERAVIVRGVLERDGQAIAGFQTVLGKYALEKDPGDGSKPPQFFRVDVLKDVAQRPASMLLFARAEILLAGKGADELVLDPATLQAEPADISAKISNPMRIEFAPADAAVPAPAPPAEAAAPAPAPGAAQ